MISCAMIIVSTAWRKASTSNCPSGPTNFIRFSDDRLQAESSRNMYSEQGFDALMRAVFLHGMPAVDGGIELHAGVAALVRGFGDLAHQVARLVALHRLAVDTRLGPPVAVVDDGLHELVGGAHGVVGVLEEDRAVGLAVERGIVAGLDQRVGLLLFLGLAPDELLDIRDDRRSGSPSWPRGASCRRT